VKMEKVETMEKILAILEKIIVTMHCVAAIEQGSRPVDSSSSDKVMARCKTKNNY
jgi:hypothetical protein